MTKKIIITIGISASGKSRYAERWIAEHPEYVIVPCADKWDALVRDIEQHEYVIMDYYFARDYNAAALAGYLKCDIEKIVLFDSPEAISYRQINGKALGIGNHVDCYHSYHAYSIHGLSGLVNVRECRFLDGNYDEYSLDDYITKQDEYWTPYTREQVVEFVKFIDGIEGYDKYYHNLDLPHDVHIGQHGYARNDQTWEIIKDLIDWRRKRVLDLCCFHGYFSQQICFADGIPVGCDIHNDALYSAAVFAKMNGADYRLYHCDVDVEFPAGPFDVALLFNVFHHLKNQSAVLERLAQYPTVLFEINTDDVIAVAEYFRIDRIIKSPKDGRLILMCSPHNKNEVTP